MSLARWGNLCNSSSTRSLWTMLLSSRVSLLEDLENCPRKYLKIFSTEFIFRQQKILLTIERYRSLADWSWTIKYVVSFLCFLCQFWHSSHNSESRNFLHCKFYPVLTNFMANFNVLFFYMWASDLNFLLSLLAQQTVGAIACPSFTELRLFLRLTTERNQSSSRFVLVFCIGFYWPRDRNIYVPDTVCLWLRLVVCHRNLYCNLLTK